jgi:hypothetical protein
MNEILYFLAQKQPCAFITNKKRINIQGGGEVREGAGGRGEK